LWGVVTLMMTKRDLAGPVWWDLARLEVLLSRVKGIKQHRRDGGSMVLASIRNRSYCGDISWRGDIGRDNTTRLLISTPRTAINHVEAICCADKACFA